MIWIDKTTGEYGDTDKVVVIENPTPQLIELLEESSKAEIIDIGIDCGTSLNEWLD